MWRILFWAVNLLALQTLGILWHLMITLYYYIYYYYICLQLYVGYVQLHTWNTSVSTAHNVGAVMYLQIIVHVMLLISSPNIVRVIKSRRMRWAGHVARMWEERGAYKVLVGKPEGKRPLGRPSLRWVDNIRMDLQEVGWGYGDWIGLAQDRDGWRKLVNAVMNLRVP